MTKVRVRVVRPFQIYNAGDVIGLSPEEFRDAAKNVEVLDAAAPAADRLGRPPESSRGGTADVMAAARFEALTPANTVAEIRAAFIALGLAAPTGTKAAMLEARDAALAAAEPATPDEG